MAVTAGAVLPQPLLSALLEDLDPEDAWLLSSRSHRIAGRDGGSLGAAHSFRDGYFWEKAGKPAETGEKFDLIIVGGGISGLSAAHFFRKSNPNARILILDNHDDFGGHAKRNEFAISGRKLLGFGGTFAIESPAPYSPVARGVVEELGIDVAAYPKYVSKNLYRSFGFDAKCFLTSRLFGTDKLTLNP